MAKIQLSAEEMNLVLNQEWILTKHRIIDKVYRLFGSLSEQMQLQLQQQNILLPAEWKQSSPKISKGEQYEALPYVVLDYPRYFLKEHVAAIRCFFWWGNYFSCTLHLKGKFQQQFNNRIAAVAAEQKWPPFYFSFSGNEFSFNLLDEDHAYTGDTGYPGNDPEQGEFLKISFRVSFERWDDAGHELLLAFERFISVMSSH